MKIAIRADASQSIGSGHVMRMLCLANVLQKAGASVRFLSRDLPGHLAYTVSGCGHEVVSLPHREMSSQLAEAAWPEPMRDRDIQDVRAALQDWPDCAWLIVDHYAASEAWERRARDCARQMMAVDDLGRVHDSDVLLDANYHLQGGGRYAGRVSSDCKLLIGPHYALLRPEFLDARAIAQVRDGPTARLLVFMGGMDANNATGMALAALLRLAPDQRPATVDVVIGKMHPQRDSIEAACGVLRARCHVQTQDMAALCAGADLAIGAGGSATWERCVVGLPALALCLAENQREILRNASRAGLLYAPDEPSLDANALALHLLALLSNSGLRSHISSTAMAAVDGLGAQRVAQVLMQA